MPCFGNNINSNFSETPVVQNQTRFNLLRATNQTGETALVLDFIFIMTLVFGFMNNCVLPPKLLSDLRLNVHHSVIASYSSFHALCRAWWQ